MKVEVMMKLQDGMKWKTLMRALVFTCLIAVATLGTNLFTLQANAQGKATVTAASGKIRESADTSSSVLASVKKNDKLDVIASVTAGDGYTWYKVFVDGKQKGYIRADLVSKVEGTISSETLDSSKKENSDSQQNEKADDSEQPAKTTVGSNNSKTESENTDSNESDSGSDTDLVDVSPSTVVAGKVKGSSVRVRETPSTSSNVKGSAKGDTEVTVSGETTDAEGNVWYKVSYNSGDKTVTGFIRSDFIEVTQSVEPTTEEEVEEVEPQEEEEPENNDYALNYETNEEGSMEWFLYDNLKGTKQSLNNIYEIIQQSQDSEASDNEQLKKMKIILIVMAAVILLLIIGITVLLFKVRDTYDDDDYEDDEDEDDEDDYVPVKRRKTEKKKSLLSRTKAKKRYVEYDDDDEDDEDEDYEDEDYEDEDYEDEDYEDEVEDDDDDDEEVRRPSRKKSSASKGKTKEPNWQPKNFLDVDDDMEFEFLDLK